MAPSDFATINAASLTTAAMLRKIGVNVDLQVVDWGTLYHGEASRSRRPRTRAATTLSHLHGVCGRERSWGHANISTACDKAWFGWPCSRGRPRPWMSWRSFRPGPTPSRRRSPSITRLSWRISRMCRWASLPDGRLSEGSAERHSGDASHRILESDKEVRAMRRRPGWPPALTARAPGSLPCSCIRSSDSWRPCPSWAFRGLRLPPRAPRAW